VQYLENYLS